jgi:hypothetical protein
MNSKLHERLNALLADPYLSDISNSMSNFDIENVIAGEVGALIITIVVEKYDGDSFSK